MSALLKVKSHASVSQQKVFWKNQTFPSLSRSVKLVMAIVAIVAIKTIMDIKTNMLFPESNWVSNVRNSFQGDFSNLSYRRRGCQDYHSFSEAFRSFIDSGYLVAL